MTEQPTSLRSSLTHYSEMNVRTMDRAWRALKCKHGAIAGDCMFLTCFSEYIPAGSRRKGQFVLVSRRPQPLVESKKWWQLWK